MKHEMQDVMEPKLRHSPLIFLHSPQQVHHTHISVHKQNVEKRFTNHINIDHIHIEEVEYHFFRTKKEGMVYLSDKILPVKILIQTSLQKLEVFRLVWEKFH